MPKALETFHHALGTVECGTVLPVSHPIAKAAPHLFGPDDDEPQATKPAAKPAAKKIHKPKG